ncbi:hypothetical protein [Mesorhizobium sp.]|uniref:hypothetical protein n=1 Tax=Mesorhizobium sp. TaxID=1871066 RepID=UPI000FE8C16D|nr:hypothetical protein [Mesorhizobium sp.]RWH19359.1 MAG: hypothetical protein EOQ76_26875 [Mesorhizobium sp.]TIR62166.1 MAG: hypothetical protein E5X22_01410 [Mesorhizobium sp.]TIR72230.1 MAG: hypothetical protein E5X24_02435 [Mesorhizobium sp.]
MPAKSEAQRRAMYAAAEGRGVLGIPKAVGEEFVGKDSAGQAASLMLVAPDGDRPGAPALVDRYQLARPLVLARWQVG